MRDRLSTDVLIRSRCGNRVLEYLRGPVPARKPMPKIAQEIRESGKNKHTMRTEEATLKVLYVGAADPDDELLSKELRASGWDVDVCWQVGSSLGVHVYDLVVVHATDPVRASAACSRVHKRVRGVPIMLVAGGGSATEAAVAGLDAGACAFLLAPQNIGQLAALARAVARRNEEALSETLSVGDLVLEPASRSVRRQGAPIDLTAREFDLLEYLMRNAGQVVRRETILDEVWGFDYDGTSNVVDVYIGYLRRKVDRPFGTSTIRSVRGVGYSVTSVTRVPNRAAIGRKAGTATA